MDAYQYPEVARKYSIPGFPTLMLFEGENVVAVHKGKRDVGTLLDFVARHVS